MIKVCRDIEGGTQWFVFGSVLHNQPSPSDIDLLCISVDDSACSQVHSYCEDFLLNAPIHLRVLTQRQEQALRFIKRTGALEIGQI